MLLVLSDSQGEESPETTVLSYREWNFDKLSKIHHWRKPWHNIKLTSANWVLLTSSRNDTYNISTHGKYKYLFDLPRVTISYRTIP